MEEQRARRTELADHPLVGPINPAGVVIQSQRQKRRVWEADCRVGGENIRY